MKGGPAYLNPQAGYPPQWASSAGPMAWQQGVGYDPTASRGSKVGPAEGVVMPTVHQTAHFSASARAAATARATANAQAVLRNGPGNSSGVPPGYFAGPSKPPGALGAPAVQAGLQPSRFTGQFMPHRLCNHFSGTGFCKKADTCTFAHGFHELHPHAAQQLGYSGTMDMRVSNLGTAQMPAKVEELGLSNGTDTGFKFNKEAAPFAFAGFNADAVPFEPLKVEAAEPETRAQATEKVAEVLAPEPVEQASAPVESQTTPASAPSISLPGVSRRQAPAPLSISCETPKAGALQGTLLGSGSPTAALTGPLLTPLGSGSPTAIRTGPLLTPVATAGTSVAHFSSTATSPKASVVQTPTAKRVVIVASSPKAGGSPRAAQVLRNATASSTAAGLGTVLGSPIHRVTTPTPTNASWDRNFLLQARAVAKKLEAGPPGLAMCAPTPTSAARNFGFAYPQPGYVKTVPAPSKPVANAHGKSRKARTNTD